MSSPSNEASGQLVSLPAMLAMLIGAGGLFVIWKFDFLFDDYPTWKIVSLGAAVALLLWGTVRSFSDLPRAGRGGGSALAGIASPSRDPGSSTW